MWVARDKDGELFIYDRRPDRIKNAGMFTTQGCLKLNQNLFPYLKWEDEPIEVEIIEKGKF